MRGLSVILFLSSLAFANEEPCLDKFAHLAPTFETLVRAQVELDLRKARAESQQIVIGLEDAVSERREELRQAGVSDTEIDERLRDLIPKFAADPTIFAPEHGLKPRDVAPYNQFLHATPGEKDALVEKALDFMESTGLPSQAALRKAFTIEDPEPAKGFILAAIDKRWSCSALSGRCLALNLDLAPTSDRTLLQIAAEGKDPHRTVAKILATNEFYNTIPSELSTAAKLADEELMRLLMDAGHPLDDSIFWEATDRDLNLGLKLIDWGYELTPKDLKKFVEGSLSREALKNLLKQDLRHINTDEKNDEVLTSLAAAQSTAELDAFLNLGVRLNEKAMGTAIANHKVDTVKMLLRRGLTPDTLTFDPILKSIYFAGRDEDFAILKALVMAGADYGASDQERRQQIEQAIARRVSEIGKASYFSSAMKAEFALKLSFVSDYFKECWQ